MEPILIFILTFVAVAGIGSAAILYRNIRRRRIAERLLALESQLHTDHVEPPTPWQLQILSLVGAVVSIGPTSKELLKKLSGAGFHAKWAPRVFLGAKILLLAAVLPITPLLLIFTNFSLSIALLLGLIPLIIAFLVPDMFLYSCQKARRLSVRQHLPDAVDLLEVCVSAGIGLDMAWNMVSDEIRRVCPVLADEMALTNLEIHLGSNQMEAMRHLSERTGVQEVGRLVAVLVQSERFGTSISDALRTFATSMREGRSMRAEEAAEKMSVAMLLPMILFIFPAVFVVVAGPAAIILVKILGPS